MAIPLHLTEQTKEELLSIKAKLEQQTGEKCILEDVIRWSIARFKENSFENRKNRAKTLFGSLKGLNISEEDL